MSKKTVIIRDTTGNIWWITSDMASTIPLSSIQQLSEFEPSFDMMMKYIRATEMGQPSVAKAELVSEINQLINEISRIEASCTDGDDIEPTIVNTLAKMINTLCGYIVLKDLIP